MEEMCNALNNSINLLNEQIAGLSNLHNNSEDEPCFSAFIENQLSQVKTHLKEEFNEQLKTILLSQAEVSKNIKDLEGKMMKENEIKASVAKIDDPFNLGKDKQEILSHYFSYQYNKYGSYHTGSTFMSDKNFAPYITSDEHYKNIVNETFKMLTTSDTYKDLQINHDDLDKKSLQQILENFFNTGAFTCNKESLPQYFKEKNEKQQNDLSNNRKKGITNVLNAILEDAQCFNCIKNAIQKSQPFLKLDSTNPFNNNALFSTGLKYVLREILKDSNFLADSEKK